MLSASSTVDAEGTEPVLTGPELEPLLSASVDELRILTSMAGAVLPPVCDAELDGEARTAADMAAVRSLMARGWVGADEADGTAGATPAVSGVLGALLAPEVIVELEVLANDLLRRELLVVGPSGDRWLTERLLGVWDVAVAPADPMARIDALASGPGDPPPDDPLAGDPAMGEAVSAGSGPAAAPGATAAPATELDVEAELADGGREVLLRLARRIGAEQYEAHELHWVVGPSGRWVVEAADLDPDGEQQGDDVAVPADRGELEDTLTEFLATIAGALARSSSSSIDPTGSAGPAGDR